METIEEIKWAIIQEFTGNHGGSDPAEFAEELAMDYISRIQAASRHPNEYQVVLTRAEYDSLCRTAVEHRSKIEAEIMADFDSRLKKLVTTTHELYYSYAQNKYCLSPPDDPWFVSGETIYECIEKAEKAIAGGKEG